MSAKQRKLTSTDEHADQNVSGTPCPQSPLSRRSQDFRFGPETDVSSPSAPSKTCRRWCSHMPSFSLHPAANEAQPQGSPISNVDPPIAFANRYLLSVDLLTSQLRAEANPMRTSMPKLPLWVKSGRLEGMRWTSASAVKADFDFRVTNVCFGSRAEVGPLTQMNAGRRLVQLS